MLFISYVEKGWKGAAMEVGLGEGLQGEEFSSVHNSRPSRGN